ncbi:flagellar hook-length control protein FliK [Spongiibacter taiwanensis]|uniref:flagellar hook-length control protein FliK n=1 Tax=Spongiibacter taiwanensis TaxID=1748242 RepID=UPI002035D9FC|nr:flagellar hook-length control protein FliK [Spongiibacter taiwanensis]USA43792.1 flagellar hook-length control protein FliK [Spongiibacter taiwanensis]
MSNIFESLLGKGAPSGAASAAETPFNQLFTAQQLSLLGGQPQDFAAIQAQALAQFSQEQGEALSAESLLSEVALGDGEGFPLGGKGLPQLQSLLASQPQGVGTALNGEMAAEGDDVAESGLALSAMLQQMVAKRTAGDSVTGAAAEAHGEPGSLKTADAKAALNQLTGATPDKAPSQGTLAFGDTALAKPEAMTTAEGFRQALVQQSGETTSDEKVGAITEKADSDIELASLMRDLRGAQNSAQTKAPAMFTVSQNAVTDPAWSQAMAARVGYMMNNGVHTATVQLHPEELGSIQVQISLDGDSSRVQFQTQHAETSELVERMLPRLTQGFEQQGLRLDDVKVSLMNQNANASLAQGQGQGQNAATGQGGNNPGARGDQQGNMGGNGEGEVLRNVVLSRAGGVDDYA